MYRTDKGTPFPGIGLTLDECPVSYITPESNELVRLFWRNHQMHKLAGASLYGPDMGKWPARIVDAFTTLEAERLKTENAQSQAEHQDRQ